MKTELFQSALDCLLECDPERKCQATTALYNAWLQGKVGIDHAEARGREVEIPGRPDKPDLVHPRELPRRSPGTEAGKAALIHAIAHIEFNAINLALDAVVRFRHMPEAYYNDWLKVAAEEAKHFRLLNGRLGKLGYELGFAHVASGPMVRSSYHADQQAHNVV